jgi:hypothetical protein
MAGAKLQQAQKALRFCVENLNADDRFEIVRFSTEAEPLFRELVPATPIIANVRTVSSTTSSQSAAPRLPMRCKALSRSDRTKAIAHLLSFS